MKDRLTLERQVYMEDDFDPDKIAFCGQCFRAKRLEGDCFRFITGGDVLYIRQEEAGIFR